MHVDLSNALVIQNKYTETTTTTTTTRTTSTIKNQYTEKTTSRPSLTSTNTKKDTHKDLNVPHFNKSSIDIKLFRKAPIGTILSNIGILHDGNLKLSFSIFGNMSNYFVIDQKNENIILAKTLNNQIFNFEVTIRAGIL